MLWWSQNEKIDIRASGLRKTVGGRFLQSRRSLKEEKKVLIWRCDILQRAGFHRSINDVRDLAEKFLQKRDPPDTVSPQRIDICPTNTTPRWKRHARTRGRAALIFCPFLCGFLCKFPLAASTLSCDRPGRKAKGSLQRAHRADCGRENWVKCTPP